MTIIQDKEMNEIIKDYKNGLTTIKLSKKYNNYSPYIIRHNLKRCGVYQNGFISDDIVNLITEDYKKGTTITNLSKKYKFSENAIRNKLVSLGLYDKRDNVEFTNDEIEIIKIYYPFGDWESLIAFLPNRSKQSIYTKAWSLGIKQDDWFWDEFRIKQVLESKNFYLKSNFTNIKSKHIISDKEGYLYSLQLTGFLYDDKNPNRVSTENIYSTYNINLFIKLNNIKCELLSDVYINNKEKLEWKCHCGEIFLCSWSDFLKGKHQCNKCFFENIHTATSYSMEQVKDLIKNKPYKMLEETYTSISKKFTAITPDGYKVIINRNNIYTDTNPEIFYKGNPYTIENIGHYLLLNGINLKIISKEYNGNNDELLWKCKCGKIFRRSWNRVLCGSAECKECSTLKRSLRQRIPIQEIEDTIHKKGYYLGEVINEISITSRKFTVYDDDGYFYSAYWSNIKNDKELEKFHPGNSFSIQNINHYFELHRNGEYKCLSDTYTGNDCTLSFQHIPCGTIFNASLIEMQGKLMLNKKDRYYKQCPMCNRKKTESSHASALKQVFIHEFPDTSLEDKSCVNPKTKRILPTDIVNHRLKIAIEVQSSYHDTQYRKKIDMFKRNFWINKGYSFYDPDIRNYSILEMIQLFFPKIVKVPEYINYKFSNCINHVEVQKMLDNGYTIKEICSETNYSKASIHNAIKAKRILLPDGYKNKVFNIKPIVQLGKDGTYINRFESLCDADRNGFKSGTIRRVLMKKQNFSYNYFWVFEDDYNNHNYSIPK